MGTRHIGNSSGIGREWPRSTRHRAVIALCLLLSLVGGCGGGGSLRDLARGTTAPPDVVEEVERKWRSMVGGMRATVHDEARCYVAAPDGSGVDEVEPEVYCGSIRHAIDGSSDDAVPVGYSGPPVGEGSWDVFALVSGGEEGGPTSTVSAGRLLRLGVGVPAGVELVRADGKRPPADADRLAAPAPPPAEPGFVGMVEDVEISDSIRGEDRTIITPLQEVTVDRVGTAEQVAIDDRPRSPADGERFVVAELRLEEGTMYDWYLDAEADHVDATALYAVRVGSERIPFDVDGGTLVVSAPESIDPELLITVAGEDQVVSLVTGERVPDPGGAAEPYYRETTEVGVSLQYPSRTYEDGDFTLTYDGTFTTAWLQSFYPPRGWAGPGRAWLVLGLKDVGVHDFDYRYEVSMDWERTATVEDEDGEVSADTVQLGDDVSFDDSQAVFEVSAEASVFTVTYEPTFTFALSGLFWGEPANGSGQLEPLTFEVAFS